MPDSAFIPGFPSLADHALIWIFGWIMPFLSGVKGRESLDGVIFTESIRRRFYLGNSLFLFIAAAVVSLSWILQRRPMRSLGFRDVEPGTEAVVIGLVLIILLCWLGDFLITYRRQAAGNASASEKGAFPSFMPVHSSELPAYLLLSLSAAVFEETIYRGFMVTYFLPASRGAEGWPLAAATIPALLFSLAHYYQGWKAVVKIWGFSVGLGGIFMISGSLWPVMAIHFIIDFGGGCLAMYLGRRTR
ncbi:MAG: CPBP family intramembrane glutamic endopeptidase [Chitinophagaceae bacterium]|jgi:membrane protease YdiL (CAAX protease family)